MNHGYISKLLRQRFQQFKSFYIETHMRTRAHAIAKELGISCTITVNGPESVVGDSIFPLVTVHSK